MDIKKRILALFLMVSVLACVFVGCSSGESNGEQTPSTEENSTETAETPESDSSESAETSETNTDGPIAIIIPSADHGWMAGTAYYAQKAVEELGLEEGAGYKLLTSANVNEQANQIDEALSLGCAAIVLLPHNDEVTVAANKIVAADVPLIVFDRKVPEYTAYVGGDNKGIGTVTAEYLGEKLEGQGTIAVMNTPSVGSVSSERVDGFKEVMAEKYPDIVLIDVTSAGFTQEDGLKMATDMLVANSQLDAVYSIDDEPSLGILQAIKDAGRTDIKYLTGGGGNQAYIQKIGSETDIVLSTATYSPAMIGDAVKAAHKIVSGESVEKDTVIAPTIVTKENSESYLDADSPY